MNEAKFTKGPLEIKGPSLGGTSSDDGGDYAICDKDGYIIGEAIHKVDTNEYRPARENALLWSAAPEMYEALGAALEFACIHTGDNGKKGSLAYKVSEQCRLAIAKARGES